MAKDNPFCNLRNVIGHVIFLELGGISTTLQSDSYYKKQLFWLAAHIYDIFLEVCLDAVQQHANSESGRLPMVGRGKNILTENSFLLAVVKIPLCPLATSVVTTQPVMKAFNQIWSMFLIQSDSNWTLARSSLECIQWE